MVANLCEKRQEHATHSRKCIPHLRPTPLPLRRVGEAVHALIVVQVAIILHSVDGDIP